MVLLKRIVKNIKQPWNCINYLNTTCFRRALPDKLVICCQFRTVFGKKLNLIKPETFNEKLQWLKLYDRNPYYSKLVDKYEAKEIVAQKIGKKYVIPTYGVWDSLDAIDFDKLPDSFVLKTTHDSHGIEICKNKNEFDIVKAKINLNRRLKNNYFYNNREWPYKNIKPRIIAEQYMEDSTYHDLRDYKFFCFNGIPKAMYIASERYNPNKPTAFDFFDMDFNHLSIIQGHPNAEVIPEKPLNFEKMKELAQILSSGLSHVRVDFYEIDGDIYFGELTFFHFGGLVPFEPDKWDSLFGNWITFY